MTPDGVAHIVGQMFVAAFWISAPLLGIGFATGIVISLIQVLTSIQDSGFNSIPRLIAFLGGSLLLMPWMVHRAMAYTIDILETSAGMGVDPLFSYATLFGFLFALARVSGVFVFMPLALFPATPQTARIVLSLALTLMLHADWRAPAGVESSIGRVVAGLARESALGLAIGVSLGIVIEVFRMAAQAVSLPAGLGFASTVDPTSGADSTVLLTMAELTAALLFFASGADLLFVKALAESLRLAPPGSVALQQNWAFAIISFGGSIFSVGLRLAAPVIALLLLGDASLAVLGRTQPQLHVIGLTMPVKLSATMLMLSITVMLQPRLLESLTTSWARLVAGILGERALMPGASEKTEKATPQRLKRARKEGQFPPAREFVSAVQFYAFVALAGAYFPVWIQTVQSALRMGLRQAFAGDAVSAILTPEDMIGMMRRLASAVLRPLGMLGVSMLAITVFFQMASTNMGFSFSRLAPKWDRLNVVRKLKDMPGNNLGNLFQAMVMMPVMFWLTWSLVKDRLPDLIRLPMLPVLSGAATAGLLLKDALKKASFVLILLGAVMLIRERGRYSQRLRMSKQDIREEFKDMEGSPQTKARIRRLQRDLRRRNMMRDVATATAVVVNPTHYAVALQYEQGAMAAPRVVAKGRNFLAARIRQRAIENQVPIIENPPLAQALYKSVEVGQEIPAHLYRAVAEILAYIFKLMSNSRPETAGRK